MTTRSETGGEREGADDKGHRRGDGHKVARARKCEWLVELRAHPARPIALRQAQELAQENRQAHGRHQHLLTPSLAQRNEHHPRRCEPPGGGDRGREHESRDQQGGGRPAEHGERRDRRRIAAGGGDFAEGEIDASDQGIDQRIGRRQERIDRRQRQPIQRHLQSIGERVRHDGQGAQVAEGRGIGGSALRRRQPVANEKEELRFR